ncbi:MAG: alpha/beta fold hydrolase [Solirubrobacteraceae bacterium]
MRFRLHRRLVRAALLPSVVAAGLLTAAPAHAEFALVGVLTGGELRSTGHGTIATDEVASDYVNDPASPDTCNGEMCNDHKDLTLHQKAELRWNTSWLLDARYPGMPADPAASPNATTWLDRVGTWTSHRLVEDFAFPDDQGEGGHDENPVVDDTGCGTPLVARQPDGAPSPLFPATEDGGDDGFDASKGRSFFLNAYGATFNAAPCGDFDRDGFYGIVGFAPVDGDAMTWDLGTAPREDFAWNRTGGIERTVACDPTWTDDTPRDTERQCAHTTDLTAENRLTCALCVTDLRYEQHPGGRDGWTEVPNAGTYDGNEVRITAVVENRASKTLTVPVLLRDKASGRALEGPGLENPKTYTFPPGSTTTIQVVWRTDGFAWEKGQPMSFRDLQLLTPYGGAQQRIVVQPRPVVLVHGWNSDASAWDGYDAMLKAIHPQWAGFAVSSMNTSPFSGNDIRVNAAAEHQFIQDLRDRLNADHVDIVAHSMGGLISRQYIHGTMGTAVDGRPVVRRLVMLGTPNQGSPCADMIRSAARGIPTEQLTTGFARGFNATVTNRKGVAFSIAAGDVNERTCTSEVHGDGVVEVPSALWTVGDRIVTYIVHTSMTDDQHLLDSFVRPRLALDPNGVKKLVTGLSASRPRSSAVVPGRPVATAARAAKTATVPQGVGTASGAVHGTKKIRVTFASGERPAFAFLAPAGMAAELVSPAGKVVATQAPRSPGAMAPIRWLAAPTAGTDGPWTLRLAGEGEVTAAAVATTPRTTLAVRLSEARRGVRIAATVRAPAPQLRGARLSAIVTTPGAKAKTIRMRRAGSGRYAATAKTIPAGATVTVAAKVGGRTLTTAAGGA